MRWLLALVLLTCLAVSAAGAAEPDWWRNGGPRIRPQDQRTTLLLEQGQLRSATLRALVQRIEGSNVFVYIGMNPVMKPRLGGRLTWMGQAGIFRYLRIAINTDLAADQIIAALAHELQHAVEVIDDVHVVDEQSLVALYRRIGRPSQLALASGWETEAAQATGYQVRRELIATPIAAVADQLIDRGKS